MQRDLAPMMPRDLIQPAKEGSGQVPGRVVLPYCGFPSYPTAACSNTYFRTTTLNFAVKLQPKSLTHFLSKSCAPAVAGGEGDPGRTLHCVSSRA